MERGNSSFRSKNKKSTPVANPFNENNPFQRKQRSPPIFTSTSEHVLKVRSKKRKNVFLDSSEWETDNESSTAFEFDHVESLRCQASSSTRRKNGWRRKPEEMEISSILSASDFLQRPPVACSTPFDKLPNESETTVDMVQENIATAAGAAQEAVEDPAQLMNDKTTALGKQAEGKLCDLAPLAVELCKEVISSMEKIDVVISGSVSTCVAQNASSLNTYRDALKEVSEKFKNIPQQSSDTLEKPTHAEPFHDSSDEEKTFLAFLQQSPVVSDASDSSFCIGPLPKPTRKSPPKRQEHGETSPSLDLPSYHVPLPSPQKMSRVSRKRNKQVRTRPSDSFTSNDNSAQPKSRANRQKSQGRRSHSEDSLSRDVSTTTIMLSANCKRRQKVATSALLSLPNSDVTLQLPAEKSGENLQVSRQVRTGTSKDMLSLSDTLPTKQIKSQTSHQRIQEVRRLLSEDLLSHDVSSLPKKSSANCKKTKHVGKSPSQKFPSEVVLHSTKKTSRGSLINWHVGTASSHNLLSHDEPSSLQPQKPRGARQKSQPVQSSLSKDSLPDEVSAAKKSANYQKSRQLETSSLSLLTNGVPLQSSIKKLQENALISRRVGKSASENILPNDDSLPPQQRNSRSNTQRSKQIRKYLSEDVVSPATKKSSASVKISRQVEPILLNSPLCNESLASPTKKSRENLQLSRRVGTLTSEYLRSFDDHCPSPQRKSRANHQRSRQARISISEDLPSHDVPSSSERWSANHQSSRQVESSPLPNSPACNVTLRSSTKKSRTNLQISRRVEASDSEDLGPYDDPIPLPQRKSANHQKSRPVRRSISEDVLPPPKKSSTIYQRSQQKGASTSWNSPSFDLPLPKPQKKSTSKRKSNRQVQRSVLKDLPSRNVPSQASESPSVRQRNRRVQPSSSKRKSNIQKTKSPAVGTMEWYANPDSICPLSHTVNLKNHFPKKIKGKVPPPGHILYYVNKGVAAYLKNVQTNEKSTKRAVIGSYSSLETTTESLENVSK